MACHSNVKFILHKPASFAPLTYLKFSDDKINRILRLSRYSFATIKFVLRRFLWKLLTLRQIFDSFQIIDVDDVINDGCDMIVLYVFFSFFFLFGCPSICISLELHKCLQFISIHITKTFFFYFQIRSKNHVLYQCSINYDWASGKSIHTILFPLVLNILGYW